MSKKTFFELSLDQQKEFVDRVRKLVGDMADKIAGDNKFVIIMRTKADEGSQADATLIYFSNETDPVEVKNMLFAVYRGLSIYSNDRN